jgi:hypothetical protein
MCAKCWGLCWNLALNGSVWALTEYKICSNSSTCTRYCHVALCVYFSITLYVLHYGDGAVGAFP